jgi:hypothetical protein
MLSVIVHKAGMNALKAIVNVKLILPKQGLEFKLQSHWRVNTLHLCAFNREVEVTGLTVHFMEQEI